MVQEKSDRETDKLNQLEYIFIDDPVTSLDDNHLIQMSVNLSTVIRKSESGLKFIITTDIVNIGLHFILKNVRPYAASCSEA
mgnify:CR=1 FL=1